MAKDYYDILGIQKGASADEIKKAYRKMAHKYHPDKKGGDEAKFKEVNEAYQVLGDDKKRAQYDQFGAAGFGGAGAQGFGGFDFSNFANAQGFNVNMDDIGINVEDIFDMFGGGARRSRTSQGQGADIQVSMDIDLKDAARGVTREIGINKDIACTTCDGTGAKGKDTKECSTCKGQGQVRQATQSILGAFNRVRICPDCKGSGKLPKDPCKDCKGEGRKQSKDVFTIDIPAGMSDGETLVMRGNGQAGLRGAGAGDLYISIHVRPDKRFARVQNDLVSQETIKLTDALLGVKMKVLTLDGDQEIAIPAGSNNGDEVRIKGAGVHGRYKGDQIVKLKIDMPSKLSKKARGLVEELAEEL